MSLLLEQLKRHEGFRDKPYKDSVGKLTIGYGRNLDDVPMREEEAMCLLRNDITAAERELYREYPAYRLFKEARRDALINMCFNLGISRFNGFKLMHKALEEGNYREASYQMLNSKWAKQVGYRARELALQVETGEW